MNGKNHLKFSLYLLICLIIGLVSYKNYTIIPIERMGFWFLSITLYLNPDADTKSCISNNLGLFKYIFLPLPHRGISHSPILWSTIAITFGYFGYVPEAIGLFVPAMAHIGTDWISTEVKSFSPLKWIKNVVKKTF